MVPWNLNDSTAVTEMFMMVRGWGGGGGGGSRGVSPEVHYYLHCFERVKLQVVTARQGKFIYIAHVIHSGNSKCFT